MCVNNVTSPVWKPKTTPSCVGAGSAGAGTQSNACWTTDPRQSPTYTSTSGYPINPAAREVGNSPDGSSRTVTMSQSLLELTRWGEASAME